jgi:AraC-like DNA-binding protein
MQVAVAALECVGRGLDRSQREDSERYGRVVLVVGHAGLLGIVAADTSRAAAVFDVHERSHVAHHRLLTPSGSADVRWRSCGAETAYHATVGTIGFFPCDHPPHSVSITSVDGFSAYDVIIPDGHLRTAWAVEGVPMALVTLADTVRLSPGHFARKFHRSAGLSLNRFINVRRIAASFLLLRQERRPLAGIALDLGFSSQSQFTRLFSGLTGISPEQFRSLHRRVVGRRMIRGDRVCAR